MHNIAQIIKKIFFSIIVLSIIALLITDYNYFNKNKTNASDNRVKILGNSIVPDEGIINMISQKNHQKSIYNSIVNELKVINISNKEQVVIIDEDNIRFYDDDYNYMSSGKKISLSKN